LPLSWLPPLREAARLLGVTQWDDLAGRSLRRQLNAGDVTRWNASTQWCMYGIEALVELGEHTIARAALRPMAAMQKRNGDVPALPQERWVSSIGLALAASAWYQFASAEECHRADRSVAALVRRQRRGGGFPGSWGRDARCGPGVERPLAAALFLDALHWQVRRAFTSRAGNFPAQIVADDGRLTTVLEWCDRLSGSLARAPRIVDVGCGRGRYLRHIQRRLPRAHLVGVDVSPAALAQLPEGVTARQGDLLRIPAATAEFDAAICIEALEHSLLPSRAVVELCRVVRPGGDILLIDKNLAHQPLSDHQPWERWFRADEVCQWLAPYAEEVAVRTIAHGANRKPSGVFFCWTARRASGTWGRRSDCRPGQKAA
jgi:malonyl-CoA O-methyltransferase